MRNDPDFDGLFFGVAKVTEQLVEKSFGVLFTKRIGAAAAHDLLVRRMRAVMGPQKFRRHIVFESLYFPEASWSGLCSLVLACATKKDDFTRAKPVGVKSPVTPVAKAKPPVTRSRSKRKIHVLVPPQLTNVDSAQDATCDDSPDQDSPATAFPETAFASLHAPAGVSSLETILAQAHSMRNRGLINDADYDDIKIRELRKVLDAI